MEEKITVGIAIKRLESDAFEINSILEFLRKQDPEADIESLIDEDVKESILEYLDIPFYDTYTRWNKSNGLS